MKVLFLGNSHTFYNDMPQIFADICKERGKGKGHGIGLKKLRKIVLHRKGEIMVSNNREGNVNFLEFCVWLPGKESPADH